MNNEGDQPPTEGFSVDVTGELSSFQQESGLLNDSGVADGDDDDDDLDDTKPLVGDDFGSSAMFSFFFHFI